MFQYFRLVLKVDWQPKLNICWNPIVAVNLHLLTQNFIFSKFKDNIRDQREIPHRLMCLLKQTEKTSFRPIPEVVLRIEKIDWSNFPKLIRTKCSPWSTCYVYVVCIKKYCGRKNGLTATCPLYFYRFFPIKRYGRDSNGHINSTRGRLHDTLQKWTLSVDIDFS